MSIAVNVYYCVAIIIFTQVPEDARIMVALIFLLGGAVLEHFEAWIWQPVIRIYADGGDFTLPKKAYRTDGAWDISAGADVILEPYSITFVPTAYRIICPEGYFITILGRSSMNMKGLTIPSNVIDAGYTGKMGVIIHNTGRERQHINAGDRIAQMTIHKVEDVVLRRIYKIPSTARQANGFGSSGKN